MSRDQENDTPDDSDDTQGKDAVVPEAGEGPIPPLAGEPRPPIGN
ncbi:MULTISPECIES: hypothetical protein [Mycobacterium]|nr:MULTISPECIES: hypothetical protein [Mycobacterium]MCQ4364154.1 hypothetical protein [Mycobacterium gordonae]